MFYLFIVTLVWAFSFGLIKGNLTGLDSNFVSLARMFFSLLVFLPFLRLKKINFKKLGWKLMLTGAVEFGIMYIAYIASFQYLKAYEVALFTIFTPIFVTLINDFLSRRFHWLFLVTAVLAVVGTGVIVFKDLATPSMLRGFLLVQVSNLAFAFGQIYYKRLMQDTKEVKDQDVFGLLYLGAFITTGIASLLFTKWETVQLGFTQIWTLAYLGTIASGVCFFLWNLGARKVDAGALAIFNDLKVPLSVLVSLLVFGEQTDLTRLLIGGAIILVSLGINEYVVQKKLVKATA